MNKHYKILTLAALLTMTTTQVAPSVQAATNNTNTNSSFLNRNTENFENDLKAVGSNYFTVTTYAQSVFKQSDIAIDNTNIKPGLKIKIKADQTNAKKHAKYWLQGLTPKFIQIIEDTREYNDVFNAKYKKLSQAIEAQDKSELKKLLGNLIKEIDEKKNVVKELVGNVHTFQADLMQDHQNLQFNGNELLAELNSVQTGLPNLKRQIEIYKATIDKSFKYLVGSGIAVGVSLTVGLGVGVTIITGGIAIPALATAGILTGALAVMAGFGYNSYQQYNAYQNATYGLESVMKELSSAELAISTLTATTSSIASLTKEADEANKALQKISGQWSTISSNYKNILSRVDKMDAADFADLQDHLDIAQTQWSRLNTIAEKISEDLTGLKK
ncbi:HBL/NHE enterotoxin family protein [Bacillus thuringiensis]|uniref:HBL/NHE enterotoxin family protein n=1 Tax=Bacillus thuringiensis TaxID=1428 RepID=UPI003D0205DC